MMNMRRISIALMVVTIAAIVLFQAYWLRKNYAEESRVLTLRTNLLFKETLLKLQATKLHIDTSIDFPMPAPDPSGVLNMVNVVKERVILDSPGKAHHSQAVIVTMREEPGQEQRDTGLHNVFLRKSSKIAAFLEGVDSLQDPVTVKDIQDRFTQVLAKEGIHLPFVVTVVPLNKEKDLFYSDSTGGRVILGFSKPLAYQVFLGNTFWVMARRIGPQLILSLVLVGVTIFSFLLLYRNWRQQQKLTILKNDFISNITHELKTPIATVSVVVEALKEFDALKDPDRTREYLEISTHELQRLSLLVDKVLKLSLYERQEIELRKEEFDMKMLLGDVMASMRLQFEKYQARVRLWTGPYEPGIRVVKLGEDFVDKPGKVEPEEAQPGKFLLKADKLHFTSVIFNLLDNALKYGKASPWILINLHWESDHIRLTVADNGIGIPEGYKDRIFEKFFRVPTGDHHNVKGYGLGLSYVAYVVQRHGGEIKVKSEVGVGSQFIIKIPRGYV